MSTFIGMQSKSGQMALNCLKLNGFVLVYFTCSRGRSISSSGKDSKSHIAIKMQGLPATLVLIYIFITFWNSERLRELQCEDIYEKFRKGKYFKKLAFHLNFQFLSEPFLKNAGIISVARTYHHDTALEPPIIEVPKRTNRNDKLQEWQAGRGHVFDVDLRYVRGFSMLFWL